MAASPKLSTCTCARRLLDHLAAEALRLGFGRLRLETGTHQAGAIRLYERYGFTRIPPSDPYRPDALSDFSTKRLGGHPPGDPA
jgi:putative acetyltransferase